MKRQALFLFCLILILGVACNSTKEVNTATPQATTAAEQPTARQAGPRGQGGPGSGQAQMDELMAELGLNVDQKEEFQAINAKYRQQMRTMREEANGDFSSMRTKMQEMRTAQNEEIKQILTEEQFAKYEKFLAERRRSRQGGRRPGGN